MGAVIFTITGWKKTLSPLQKLSKNFESTDNIPVRHCQNYKNVSSMPHFGTLLKHLEMIQLWTNLEQMWLT